MENFIIKFLQWLLNLFAPSKPPVPPTPPPITGELSSDLVSKITQLAKSSPVATLSWRDRGVAPIGYTCGMPVAFGDALLKLRSGDSAVKIMARAVHETPENDLTDALSWYNSNFHAIGMDNDANSVDTLRHLFVLMTSLGMMESSGRYCEGRDRSANNVTADTAESGLFQMSWDIHTASVEFSRLMGLYSTGSPGYLSIFQDGVHPTPADLEIAGSGDGAKCQKLCKDAPMFAVMAAGVGLRTRGGKAPIGHWGPIRAKKAEIRLEVDALYKQVQALVDGAPATQPRPPVDPVKAPPVQAQWPKESTPGALDAFYGDPRGPDGGASPEWMAANLVKITPPWRMVYEGDPIREIVIHRKCAASLSRALKKIWDHYGHDQSKIDALHLNEFDGSFNFRTNRNNPNKLSTHAYAAAIDLAAKWNPNGKEWKPNCGMMPIDVVKIFAEEGVAWGGQFSVTKDPMHWQWTFNSHADENLPVA